MRHRSTDTGLRVPARTSRKRATRALLYATMIAVTLIAVFPLYWLVSSSLKSAGEFGSIPPTLWPQDPTLSGYQRATSDFPFLQATLNSVLIATTATASVLLTSIMAGYVFAKYPFRGRELLFWTLIATMFIPPVVTLVPLFSVIQAMGLSDTFLGVVLPWLANPFGIFLMRQFISDIPDELIEAARSDGAGEWRILFRIIVPNLGPALVTLAIFCFVYYWNNFIWPLSVLHSRERYPVVLLVNGMISYNTSVQYRNVVLAGAVLASLPTIILFLASQRVFVQGIARSGIKG